MAEQEQSFIEKYKYVIIGVAGLAIVAVVAITMSGGGDTVANGNAKVDNSKAVRSNVGDQSKTGGSRIEGMSVGNVQGGFQIGNSGSKDKETSKE